MTKKYDINDILFNTKKELVIKDYESLFNVYGRQTNIVLTFRSWTITLLTGYYGFLLATKLEYSCSLILLIPFFIITMFLVLEVAERSVMVKLLEELRTLEKMFMENNEKKLRKKIMKYEFRDIRDTKQTANSRIGGFFKAFLRPQIISWYLLIIVFNILITCFILSQKGILTL
jgi:hypothetical protein